MRIDTNLVSIPVRSHGTYVVYSPANKGYLKSLSCCVIGNESSYTNDVTKMAVYSTLEKASKNCCNNEMVTSLPTNNGA